MNQVLHSKAVHKMEKEEKTQEEKYGIYNLISLVSILSILRYLIEDYKDYGFIMKIPLHELSFKDSCFFLLNFSFLSLASLFCFEFEKWRVLRKVGREKKGGRRVEKNKRGRRVEINKRVDITKEDTPFSFYKFFFFVCLISANFVTVFITFFYIEHVYIAGWSLIISTVLTVKILSFYLVSNELQASSLSLRHFFYFLLAPTLCYQPSYPMNDSRRYRRIAHKSIQLVAGVFLFVFVMDQYSISSIYRTMESEDWLIKIENIINVAISTAFLFLIFFHLVFVCALDIIAELTLFKDRQFYQAWWNSTTVGEFWTLWNIPVHNWFKRHLYIPLLQKGTNKQVARAYCFLLSAILHEFVLSVATKKFCGWIFLGMIFQIPNIYVSELVKTYFPCMANYFFWCSFCVIGQPTIVILYYRSKYLRGLE